MKTKEGIVALLLAAALLIPTVGVGSRIPLLHGPLTMMT